MSGTSADGVDAALVRLPVSGPGAELLAFHCEPYEEQLRTVLLDPAGLGPAGLARLDAAVADVFIRAARSCMGETPCDLAGSHGQTLVHLPGEATLQVGDGCRLAEALQVNVVSDFRQAHLARGLGGAPLSPLFDALLFPPGRAVLNLGGTANLTLLEEGADPTGWDLGPANGLSDRVVRSNGLGEMDTEGSSAAKGTVDEALLAIWLDDPALAPTGAPHSMDTAEVCGRLQAAAPPDSQVTDLLATAAALTARLTARALAGADGIEELLLCGGGVHNRALTAAIEEAVSPLPVHTTAERGIDPDAREAIGMAVLARERLAGRSPMGKVSAP